MDYPYKSVVSPFLTNGLLYMGVHVLLNYNPNMGQLFGWFDNAVIPFSLVGINKNTENILLWRQKWQYHISSQTMS